FYRIKKEEEENRRNKKEITTKFDEEPFFQLYSSSQKFQIKTIMTPYHWYDVIILVEPCQETEVIMA
uniref:hypothetical protein n=1 Tax=Bacteroides xylanisolvens TaxID=371601 RepID=UPI001F58ECFC